MVICAVSALFFTAGTCQPQSETEQKPKVEYKPQGLKDPFAVPRKEEKEKPPEEIKESVAKVPKTPPQLIIQGLIWGGKLPQAIINGKIVKVGDMIGDVRIDGISRDGIIIFFDERSIAISSPAKNNLDNLEKRTPTGGKDEK